MQEHPKNFDDSKNDIIHFEQNLRHIRNVHDAAIFICRRLLHEGKTDLARSVIVNAFTHDLSKYSDDSEWEHLRECYKYSEIQFWVKQHQYSNPHHPSFYKPHSKMPEDQLIVMVCDWYARSCEKGTSMLEWVKTEVPSRFEFTKSQLDLIHYYTNMLLTPKFKY